MGYQLAVSIVKTGLNGTLSSEFYIDREQALAILVVLSDGDILDMGLGGSIEIRLAGDTCKAPEVLVLKVRAIAPPQNLHGNQVLAGLQVLGNVKLGCYL